MRRELFELLACPQCPSSTLTLEIAEELGGYIERGAITCGNCQIVYPIRDGFPVMLPLSLQQVSETAPTASLISSPEMELKRQQIRYFGEVGPSEFEVTRPHGCGRLFKFLIDHKFSQAIALAQGALRGATVLDLCCGSGMDTEYLVREGAQVIGLDIALGAVRGARMRRQRFGLAYDLVVGDAEHLPLRKGAVDFGFSHDGLHHLSDPARGVAELARVACRGVLITEPADAFITKCAIRVGLASRYEESGNYVYRFRLATLGRWFEELGLTRFRWRRYGMYYPHHPPRLFRLLEPQPLLGSFKLLFYLANALFGRWGNKLTAIAWKDQGSR